MQKAAGAVISTKCGIHAHTRIRSRKLSVCPRRVSVFRRCRGGAGYEIRRVMFGRPIALSAGFRAAEGIIGAARRPLTSFCACELRSPAPFTETEFRSFNESYVSTLAHWGIFDESSNPVARSNVCPELDPPSEVSLHAFSYTARADSAAPTFVVAGSGEAPEGHAN